MIYTREKLIKAGLILLLAVVLASCGKRVDSSDQLYENLVDLYMQHRFIEARELIAQFRQEKDVTATLRRDVDSIDGFIDRYYLEYPITKARLLDEFKQKNLVVSETQLLKWEMAGQLEFMEIDGEKRYFVSAPGNLFLLNDSLREMGSDRALKKASLNRFCLAHISEVLEQSRRDEFGAAVMPVEMQLDYTVELKDEWVPSGDTVRAWMPYGARGLERQPVVELLDYYPRNNPCVLSAGPHHSLYLEGVVQPDSPARFFTSIRLVSKAQYFEGERLSWIDFGPIPDSIAPFLAERPPHLAFTPQIRLLADSLTNAEMRPFEMVRRFYYWINDHIPWASAVEYGLMTNIPAYTLEHQHGDCGMQTLLFMALCRYKGIPVRWQTGWMLHPGNVNLHDWCEVWYQNVGWVPVDVSFKLQQSPNKAVREFYISGIDAYRLVVNNDYGRSFQPPKYWPRSEPVDFQRGELEWEGGNLFFNKWSRNMEVSYKTQ